MKLDETVTFCFFLVGTFVGTVYGEFTHDFALPPIIVSPGYLDYAGKSHGDLFKSLRGS